MKKFISSVVNHRSSVVQANKINQKMFKLVTITVLALALQASARPQDAAAAPPVAIVSQTQVLDGTGTFSYAFESADGVKEEATGSLKSIKVPKLDESGQKIGEEDGQGKVCAQSYKPGIKFQIIFHLPKRYRANWKILLHR